MTLCCCLPAGIVGLVYNSKLKQSLAMQDFQQADKHAKTVRTWLIVGLILGILGNLLVGGTYFLLALAEFSKNGTY